jgi:YVTN family beta-propeller protein
LAIDHNDTVALNHKGLALDNLGNSNNVNAQELHQETLYEIANHTSSNEIPSIPVGKIPSAIGVNEFTNTIYVVNTAGGTVSVIDSKSNKVVTRVMFNVEPFNSGHIECDNVKSPSPLLQQFYLYSGAKCTAKPNPGFEFVSWQENLNGNSTQLLQLAPAPSILDSILDLFHMKPDKPEATLNISKFGSFTANFKSLPPPVPPEYIATLFTVVVTAFVGTWLIPTVIGWRKSRNQGKKLDYYYNEINNLKTNVLEENGKIPEDNLTNINNSRIDIEQQYTRGKINKEQFDKLSDDLSKKYREMFKNEIDYLNNLPEYNKENRLSEIKKDIENAYADEKINEMHYKLLKENISGFEK